MNLRRSKLLSGIAAVAAATIALTGCSGGGGAKTDTLTYTDQVPKEDATLQVWSFLPGNYEGGAEAYKEVIAAFNKKYPQVTVKLTDMPYSTYWDQLRNSGVSRSGPDVVTMYGGAQAYSYRNSLFPMQDAMSPEVEKDLRYIDENYSKDGNLYMLPVGAYGYALITNQSLFEKAGLDAKKSLATWDGLLSACTTLSDKGIPAFASGWQDGIQLETLLYMISSQLMDTETLAKWTKGELPFDDPIFHTVIDRVLEMNKAGCFGGEEALGKAMYNDAFDQFDSGKAAMSLGGGLDRAENDYKTIPSLTVIPLPQVPESKHESLIDAGADAGWAVTKWTKHPEAANAFVNFLAGPEAQQILWDKVHVVPNNNAVDVELTTPMQKVYIPLIMNPENHTGFSSFPLELLAVVERNAGPLVSGKMTVDEFFDQANRAYEKNS